MDSVISMDKYDKRILTVLQRDGRISNKQLAEEVNLSKSEAKRS